jgi:hypothetical protein
LRTGPSETDLDCVRKEAERLVAHQAVDGDLLHAEDDGAVGEVLLYSWKRFRDLLNFNDFNGNNIHFPEFQQFSLKQH